MSQYLSLYWSKKAFIIGQKSFVGWSFRFCLTESSLYKHSLYYCRVFFFLWSVGLRKRMASFSTVHIIKSCKSDSLQKVQCHWCIHAADWPSFYKQVVLKEVLALKHHNHNPHYQCSHWADLSQQMWVTLPVLLSLLHFRPHQFPLQFHLHLNNLPSIPDLLYYLQLYLPDLVYCLSTSFLSSLCKTFVHMILVHSPFWSYNVIILCGITTALKCRHFSQHCSRCCSSFLRSRPDVVKLWSLAFSTWLIRDIQKFLSRQDLAPPDTLGTGNEVTHAL